MESATVSSDVKIDMSLDDIIKLNKKDKKVAAAKKKTPVKRLTAAQKKRANALKAKAQKTQSSKNQTSRPNPTKKTSNAGIRGRIQRKAKVGMTSGGSANAGRKNQTNKPKNPSPAKALRGSPRQQLTIKKSRGGANSQNTLGVRIQNSQTNQRSKRHQVMNQRRPGLQQSTRGTGMNRLRGQARGKRNTASARSNAQTAQNRRYNQQPRRQYGQQARGRGHNQKQRGRGRRGAGRGSASERTVTLY